MPVHGIDDGNNKKDVYTTEEVLSVLQQAINSGTLQGIDPTETPIVAAVRESHNNSDVTFWSGTEAEFNELAGVTSELVGARIGSDGKLYLLTGDTTLSDTVEAARQAALEATEGMKREVISVTLTASGWSNTAPYTQTVGVAGMTADKDFLAPYLEPSGNESDDIAAQVALSCISGGTTDTDSVTFYCYDEKPTTTITVYMVDKGTKIEPGGYPIASKTAPGIMKVGDGLDVDENGVVSAEVSAENTYTKTESDTLRNTNDYYDEITYSKERFYDTDCYFVTIPMTDSNGDEIELYIGDGGGDKTPLQYAQANHTTFTSNATLNMGGSIGVGSLIANGVVLRNIDTSSWQYDANLYLGIKANREIVEYQFNETTAAQMLNDGCVQAWDVYYKILENGQVLDMSNVSVADSGVPTNKHPRQCLGQKADGTIIMLSCDARTSINAGLTSEETAQLLLDKGCVNAWNLDGGGSTSTMIKEAKLNRNIDGDGTKDRKIQYTLNVKKPTVNTALAKAFSKIAEEKQNIIQQIIPFIGAASASTDTAIINGQDLDDLADKIYVAYGNNLANYPPEENLSAGYFINIPHSWDEWKGKYCTQFFIRRDANRIWTRQMINETFTAWERVNGMNRLQMRSASATTLAQQNVYEATTLKSYDTNNSALFSKVDYDSTTQTFTKFKINKSGSCYIRAQLQYTAAVSGNKFISFFKGETNQGISTTRFHAEAGEETIATTEYFVTDLSKNDEFSLRIYGNQGDSCERVKIMVEVD